MFNLAGNYKMNQIGFGAAVPPDKNYAQLVDGDDVIHIFGYRTSASKTVISNF